MKTSKTVELSAAAQSAIEELIKLAEHQAKSMTRYHKLEVNHMIQTIRESVGDNRDVY